MKYYYFTAYSTNLVLCVYFLGFPYNGVVDYPNIFLLLYHNLIVFNTDLCCTCTTLSGKRQLGADRYGYIEYKNVCLVIAA